MNAYDFVVVGAGLTGATIARVLHDHGKRVLVVDRRQHVAGNCYTMDVLGVQYHAYGPHIFHTSHQNVWSFVRRFCTMNPFRLEVEADVGGKLYPFPINAGNLALYLEDEERLAAAARCPSPPPDDRNFETWCVSVMGEAIYRKFYYGYTKKMWGMEPSALPAAIAKRIPFRQHADRRYFDDPWEGVPDGGYTALVNRLLDGIEKKLRVEFLTDRVASTAGRHVVFTGAIDEFYGYCFGPLPYRSLRFDLDVRAGGPRQAGVSVNLPDLGVEATRRVEHNHFTGTWPGVSVMTTETPGEFLPGLGSASGRFYPIGLPANQKLYDRYAALSRGSVTFCGRLGQYRYLNMDQAVLEALDVAQKLLVGA